MVSFVQRQFVAAIVVAAIMLTGAPSRSYAETGSVRIRITKVGFIVGVGGDSGTLTFRGQHYRLSVGDVSAGTIGGVGADLVGTASNLRTAVDIVSKKCSTAPAYLVPLDCSRLFA